MAWLTVFLKGLWLVLLFYNSISTLPPFHYQVASTLPCRVAKVPMSRGAGTCVAQLGSYPVEFFVGHQNVLCLYNMTVWPSGLRRWLQAPVRRGVGSNPTAVTLLCRDTFLCDGSLCCVPNVFLLSRRWHENTHRGARAHDREVKGLARCRLS